MIWKYLSQQYPYEENKWKIILPVSLFIMFFMLIFQPFGLSELQDPGKQIILAGFGLVTFIILIIDLIILPLIFPNVYIEEKWTVVKELLHFLLILFTIGLGNLVYSHFFIGFRLSLRNILTFQAFTIAIGIIPITVLTLVKQNYLNRKNISSAAKITAELRYPDNSGSQAAEPKFYSESGREELVTEFDNLVFIKSDGNYITVGYLKGGKFNKILIRNTMKYAEDLFSPYPAAFKCHRSWLVNLDKIVRVTGNSQGLKLELSGCEEPVPVARNLAADFKHTMQERNA